MSPEIIKGNYDEKCDIWACGVILYTLLGGYPPFNGSTDKDIYSMISQIKYDFNPPVWKNVSKYAKELIKNMLSPAKNRFTAQEVLSSKWFSVKLKKDDEKLNYYLDYKHIEKYKSHNKFKQAILTFIASRLSSEESEKIRNIFYSIDESKKGFITYEEFANYIVNECNIDDIYEKEDDIKKAFKSVDIDHNNAIDYTEFLAANLEDKVYLKEEKLKEAFRAFDLEDTGFITKEDIIRVLKLENLEEKDKIVNKIIEQKIQNNPPQDIIQRNKKGYNESQIQEDEDKKNINIILSDIDKNKNLNQNNEKLIQEIETLKKQNIELKSNAQGNLNKELNQRIMRLQNQIQEMLRKKEETESELENLKNKEFEENNFPFKNNDNIQFVNIDKFNLKIAY